MSICADKDWTMELVKVPSEPPRKETFSFRDVRIVNGIVTGKVYDKDENPTDLRGSCFSFGPVAHMTFVFTAAKNGGGYVDIVLSGGGFQLPDEQPRFTGRFEVFTRASQGQSEALALVNFEPGDTGTGTGMQAQIAKPNRT